MKPQVYWEFEQHFIFLNRVRIRNEYETSYFKKIKPYSYTRFKIIA